MLSIVTTFMNVGGNSARIATSLKEGLAAVVIAGFALNLALNIVLFLQILFFWSATAKALKGTTATPSKTSKKDAKKKD